MGKGTGTEFANSVKYLKAVLSCERKGEVNYLFGCEGNFRFGEKNIIQKTTNAFI